ncbi:hypothetical protein ACHQM5_025547 [Ranunculus cassubicifolius]
MVSLHILVFLFAVFTPIAANTLAASESLIDGQTLTSQGGTFELGFFTPSSSTYRYLGIWYKTVPVQTPVWVANRDTPLNDTSGVFKIGPIGNIIITTSVVNQSKSTIIWSTNSSRVLRNPVLEFLESGNLVLRDANNGVSIWESFDYPGNTLLPGMKLGWNLNTGMNRYLSTWKNPEDPSHGSFTYGMDLTGYLETALRNGSSKRYRGGPWNGLRFSGSPDLKPNSIFRYEVFHNAEEIYYSYQLVNRSVIMRSVLTQTSTQAHLQLLTWVDKNQNWVLLLSIPRDRCDDYALCGAYSTCDTTNVTVCQCLKGFKPKSPEDWSETDWSGGCEREMAVNCTQGEGFRKYTGVRLPDTTGTWVNARMNLKECRAQCLKNCSCMAYTNSDIRGSGSGCLMWFADLVDIRQLSNAGQDLYVRMAASDLDSKSSTRIKLISIVTTVLVAGFIALGLVIRWIGKKTSPKGDSPRGDLELPLYDLLTITTATNNFSKENKLGEGGFGPVYKGILEGGQEIAVKRLSKDSIQGLGEFKNEILLISKLQHRNLVKLIGCCLQGEEMILVYEYMQNNSLDTFIFDATKSEQLYWGNRFEIILGIARGLLYLHCDSRLRIIHRDLKASNVLLDSDMVPRISDFGMARIFRGEENEANTRRVVGTYGYMSPEYAIDGHFSVKSDVFSFGVLVLEIISGKKNRSFHHPDHDLNLLGHAWRLWEEGKSLELVEDSMRSSCVEEVVMRCIHVGLLCVQRRKEERPTMPYVVLALSSQGLELPKPQKPGFYMERSTIEVKSAQSNKNPLITSEMTITMLEGR